MPLGLRLNGFTLLRHDMLYVANFIYSFKMEWVISDMIRPSLVGCVSKCLLKAALEHSESWDVLLISLLQTS